jgi:hypothetical protein
MSDAPYLSGIRPYGNLFGVVIRSNGNSFTGGLTPWKLVQDLRFDTLQTFVQRG